ncbi:MAG: cob(I)yrinic acid a,c-diamide adenosyltransferase [Syntrophales bacterium]|jgi:cob(I)alamin adenosyltransferase|nr:cob(I)yrinic acid a,c-diamide adenosyltransferase [Syntrophales bacterium]
MTKGYIQVYTGGGKGKTTAALGLALRAAGADLQVYFAQFIKGSLYSEIKALKALAGHVTLRQYGRGGYIRGTPHEEDIRLARAGLTEAREMMRSGRFDIVILDEVNVAVRLGLLTVKEMLDFIDAKPVGIELVLTGRDADPEIVERADLVTEMREIKHYFTNGVAARRGIEQ